MHRGFPREKTVGKRLCRKLRVSKGYYRWLGLLYWRIIDVEYRKLYFPEPISSPTSATVAPDVPTCSVRFKLDLRCGIIV